MQKFTTKNKIIIAVALILIFISVGQSMRERAPSQADEQNKQSVPERTSAQPDAASKAIFQQENMRGESENALRNTKNTETITVVAGQDKISLSVTPDTTFYDALVQARTEGKISFAGKNYPALGFFLTDIESLHAGKGKDLLYYVNGKEATVGVSKYVLKDGDILEWKLE
jgi:hypothetical protein